VDRDDRTVARSGGQPGVIAQAKVTIEREDGPHRRDAVAIPAYRLWT
jgi:hypothetical protein